MKKEIIIVIILLIITVGGAIGVKACQAKFIYNDMRCIWAECRITK